MKPKNISNDRHSAARAKVISFLAGTLGVHPRHLDIKGTPKCWQVTLLPGATSRTIDLTKIPKLKGDIRAIKQTLGQFLIDNPRARFNRRQESGLEVLRAHLPRWRKPMRVPESVPA